LKAPSSIFWFIALWSKGSKMRSARSWPSWSDIQGSWLETYNARFGIASILKHALSELKLASAGSDPTPTLRDSRIRRDNSERFFEIKLWDEPTYVGFPIEA
jgi:hypothetical protein